MIATTGWKTIGGIYVNTGMGKDGNVVTSGVEGVTLIVGGGGGVGVTGMAGVTMIVGGGGTGVG